MAVSYMACIFRAAAEATVLILVSSAAVLWNVWHEVILLIAGRLPEALAYVYTFAAWARGAR